MDMKSMIWGAGTMGVKLTNNLHRMGYDLSEMFVGYCDRDKEKQGKSLNGLPIMSPEALRGLCQEGAVDCVVLGVGENLRREIREELATIVPTSVKILDFEEFLYPKKLTYIEEMRERMKPRWNIDFDSQADEWVRNFMTEVQFWVRCVAKPDGRRHQEYLEALNNQMIEDSDEGVALSPLVKDGDIVMDIGCGLISKFGKKLRNGGQLELLYVDPLASFYNLINKRFFCEKSEERHCQFGMFEFMANFYRKNYSDLIIIHNALDHCIDPFKSIIECLYILKVGGRIHLYHHRAEAVFENYEGLHQWNIDYGKDGHLIIWNQSNMMDVSDALSAVAKITISISEDPRRKGWKYITAQIVKTTEFDLGQFINVEQEQYALARMIERVMGWMASSYPDYLEIDK